MRPDSEITRPPLTFVPPRIEPKCCRWAGLVIQWQQADRRGPGRTGWAMAYDLTHAIDVSFCPFCGARLPEEPRPAPFAPTRETFSAPARWKDEPRGDETVLELTWRRRSLEEWARVEAQRERAAVVEQLAEPATALGATGPGLERPSDADLRRAATPAPAARSCGPEAAPCVLCREPTTGLTPDGRAPMCPGCRRRVEPRRAGRVQET